MMEALISKDWTAEDWHPADEELLMLLDGELPARELSLGRAHLDACWACRARSEELQSTISSFVKYNDSILNPLIDRSPRGWGGFKARLNNTVLELGKPQPWYRNLLADWKRFSLFNFVNALFSSVAGFALARRAALVPLALVFVVTGIVAWFAISPSSSISAEEILTEAERRTSLWQHQPDKVLHWGSETTFISHPTLPDGKYLSRHWQYNTGGAGLRLNRLYDANGVLVSASARRPDGSYVYFAASRGGKIRVTPSRDVLMSYAAKLDERSRQVLENYVRSSGQMWQIGAERDLEIKRKLTTQSSERSVQIINTADFGKVFRVRQVILTGKDNSFRIEIDRDIAADSFLMIRNHHVDYYPDGRITTIDSELKFHEESSIEDFNAHDLSVEIRQGKNIVYVTPEEVLKNALREEEERRNRQSK